jgi:hypothetical protein
MIQKPDTFRTLIDRMGGVSSFADKLGVGEFAAKKMRDRNSVAVDHWPALIDAARIDGLIFTTDDFVNMQIKARAEARERKAKRQVAA